jgi:hypothetical protein
MEGGQFFFEVTEDEEVAWSKVWAMDRMGQALSFRCLNTFLRLLGIVSTSILEMDEEYFEHLPTSTGSHVLNETWHNNITKE